jgi:hypothetical protein
MMQLLTAQRRAEEFARAVDEGRRDHDPSLDLPVRLVAGLRAAAPVAVDERYCSQLRVQLVAAAHEELTQQRPQEPERALAPSAAPARHRRRLAAAASALVLVGGTTGVAAASESALPGDLLYPVKRAVESAELHLATTAYAHGTELLEQATTRLDEAQGLMARGPSDPGQPEELDASFTDFSDAASAGGQDLITVYRDSRDPTVIGQLREFTAAAAEKLTQLAPTTPPEATEALTAAAATVESLDATARALCPACASAIPPAQVATTLLAADISVPQVQSPSVEPARPHSPGRPNQPPSEGSQGQQQPDQGQQQPDQGQQQLEQGQQQPDQGQQQPDQGQPSTAPGAQGPAPVQSPVAVPTGAP